MPGNQSQSRENPARPRFFPRQTAKIPRNFPYLYLVSFNVHQPACELRPHGLTYTKKLDEKYIFQLSISNFQLE